MSVEAHSWFSPGPAVRPMTDAEFERFRVYIYRAAGIHLAPAKKDLLSGRLMRRMRELGIGSFYDYYHVLVHGDGTEPVHLLNAISTNETHFFREVRHFDFLRERVFGQWVRRADAGRMPRRIRLWSAGCATGEEPYTLAMLAAERFPAADGWDVEILATDLSTRAIDTARQAVWPLEKAEEIPDRYLKAYMLKGVGRHEGRMKAGMEIRSLVRCARVNLNDEVYPVNGPFDVIFCRNVLIYFDHESKTRVVRRLVTHLGPRGYLFVGQVESLAALTDHVRSVGPTVYVRTGRGARRDAERGARAGPFAAPAGRVA